MEMEGRKLKISTSSDNSSPNTGLFVHLVHCNCKAGCERNCDCRKSDLHCSTMCGESYTNRLEIDVDDYLNTVECVDEDDSHDELESCGLVHFMRFQNGMVSKPPNAVSAITEEWSF
uniref:Tesmin/TSO1-like CXC domain-containing protein n=1 Tax=Timema tahoe TaxID=61484 RepID=A0A7R9FEF5_9NEOP|nr:unnamed protein product [Timema tahoe]